MGTATSDPVSCKMPIICSPFAFFINTRFSVMVADWSPAASPAVLQSLCLLARVLVMRAAGLIGELAITGTVCDLYCGRKYPLGDLRAPAFSLNSLYIGQSLEINEREAA